MSVDRLSADNSKLTHGLSLKYPVTCHDSFVALLPRPWTLVNVVVSRRSVERQRRDSPVLPCLELTRYGANTGYEK